MEKASSMNHRHNMSDSTSADSGLIRVALVDDHELVRTGLRTLLNSQPGIEVIGEGGCAEAAFEILKQNCPDVLIMDLAMPGMSALEAIQMIAENCSDVGVIILSMHKSRKSIQSAFEAGALGYVPKSCAHTSLLRAIKVVQKGEKYLDPSISTDLVDFIRSDYEEQLLLDDLSEREVEVLGLSARGFISREIGEKLSISPKTVDTYRQRIMQKLNLGHRSELVELAYRAGLFDQFVSSI
jgi:DNA-binding NarL/FixJ family response regulator